MAIYIKPIPTLHGDVAANFDKLATKSASERATVDFTKQVSVARAILKKAKLNK